MAVGPLVREGQLLKLRGLDRDEVKGLIEVLSGVAPSQAKVAAVHERTEGNPLFVREAVRLLATEATLERPGRGGVPIPGSVRAVIRRRLGPLSADAVQVLSAAAVVGREFDLALVGPACDLPAERVLGALSEAAALGVVAEEDGAVGRYRFSHSLIREVLYERLPIPARMQLHRRVGEAIERVYGTGTGAHVAELARHFAEVAAAGEAAKALALCPPGRRPGHGHVRLRGGRRRIPAGAAGPEVRRPRRAGPLRVAAAAGRGPGPRGQVSAGQGELPAGRRDQQEAWRTRAAGARRAGLRRAAGRGRRGQPAARRAAAGGARRPGSPGFTASRAAAGPPVPGIHVLGRDEYIESLSREAVAMARRLADPAALRTALDARWMAVWGPDGLEERTALAAEVLRGAGDRRPRDGTGRSRPSGGQLAGVGRRRAVQADIAAHARLAEELPMAIHRWAATTMRALRALLHGSFEEAERLADEALALQPGRPNVLFTHLDQVALLRWEQGRLGELRDEWQGVVDQFPRAVFARAWLSLADAELGDRDDARRGLRSLAEQLPQRPRNGIWLPAMALASLLSAHLNEPEPRAACTRSCFLTRGTSSPSRRPSRSSATDRRRSTWALLATVRPGGRAADHFEAAIRAHDRLGARPLLARTRYEYARMLLAAAGPRTEPGGRAARRALATAGTLGMAAVAEGIQTLRAARAGGTVPVGRRCRGRRRAGPRNVFRREGEYWTVAYEGSVVRLKDAKGLRHLARLLAHPGREFHAADLEAAEREPAAAAPAGPRGRAGGGELEARPDLGDAGALLDATAKAAYRARLEELRAELEEAEGFNDPARAAKARAERDFLVDELARAVGLGGRDRRAASHAERARLNATRAIRGGDGQPGPRQPRVGAAPGRDYPDRPVLLLHARPARPDRLGALTRAHRHPA